MIFAFVVRKLRWLARTPFFPQFFDALLLLGTALFNRRMLAIMESLETRAIDSLGVHLSAHRFGGVGFTFGRHELGHLHGNGLFDAFVGRKAREQIVQTGQASPHHIFPKSGWVSYWVKTEQDVTNALELMRIAKRYRTAASTV